MLKEHALHEEATYREVESAIMEKLYPMSRQYSASVMPV